MVNADDAGCRLEVRPELDDPGFVGLCARARVDDLEPRPCRTAFSRALARTLGRCVCLLQVRVGTAGMGRVARAHERFGRGCGPRAV